MEFERENRKNRFINQTINKKKINRQNRRIYSPEFLPGWANPQLKRGIAQTRAEFYNKFNRDEEFYISISIAKLRSRGY